MNDTRKKHCVHSVWPQKIHRQLKWQTSPLKHRIKQRTNENVDWKELTNDTLSLNCVAFESIRAKKPPTTNRSELIWPRKVEKNVKWVSVVQCESYSRSSLSNFNDGWQQKSFRCRSQDHRKQQLEMVWFRCKLLQNANNIVGRSIRTLD